MAKTLFAISVTQRNTMLQFVDFLLSNKTVILIVFNVFCEDSKMGSGIFVTFLAQKFILKIDFCEFL